MTGKITWKVTFKTVNGVLIVRYPGWMATQDATVDDVDAYMKRHKMIAGKPVVDGENTYIYYTREFDPTPLRYEDMKS